MKKLILIVCLSSFFFSIATAQNNTSFYVQPGEHYIISAWVKENHVQQPSTYTNGYINVSHNSGAALEFYASGTIIDGWQRIIGVIEIPEESDDDSEEELQTLRIEFANSGENNVECYFDDVRVFPYNSTIKSFVYDEDTQRLVAELDENNYATFYEYDKEGGLVRVKKETERGIYTIQETRSNTKKDN